MRKKEETAATPHLHCFAAVLSTEMTILLKCVTAGIKLETLDNPAAPESPAK